MPLSSNEKPKPSPITRQHVSTSATHQPMGSVIPISFDAPFLGGLQLGTTSEGHLSSDCWPCLLVFVSHVPSLRLDDHPYGNRTNRVFPAAAFSGFKRLSLNRLQKRGSKGKPNSPIHHSARHERPARCWGPRNACPF